MRILFVIQRYGLEVAGGSELHCRWLATRLARHHQVEIATTCALDYIEWRNHYPPGEDTVDGLRVRRFPVARPRSEHRFALVQDLVYHDEHTLDEEREWVVENGPVCPALVKALPAWPADVVVFYSFRYYQSFFGLPVVADRAVLVPTAEEDPAIELPVFGPLFRAPRGILYLTPEEKALVHGVSHNESVPSVVIGSGINVPEGWAAADVRSRYALPGRFLFYAGRIDRNKGADKLFAYYTRLAEEWPEVPPLVLVGKPALPIPDHPKIRHLGFVSEEEKFALLAACEVLLMPSAYESLSVIVLEAWAMGRPVIVNAACKVLEGQCVRSGGGLFYRGYAELAESLKRIVGDPALGRALGRAGQAYVRREYDWDVVEGRVGAFFESITARSR